ncbi:hypothetical protein E1B28_001399 [Marasmius oreades]|uniref:ATP-dependent DNA helicase n=1 Tax=Marasmius oreades TaxID=181124 RepID=A0A9P8AFD0_9AGAR|nr:uncharacterized protein E1B28_001399 [Marasmius oreades]KAG7099567.1 hypothetical protein E1B28_001399 [Marasmius oreades]
MAKFKFYAVCVGREGPQIYTDWEQCKANITRYPGAKHRSFNLRSKAEDWISQHLLANPGDSDSEIELVDGPSTLKLTNIPVAHQKVDSDSDIEVVAYIPASKASKQLSLPPQSTSTQLRDTDVIVLSPEQEEVLKLMKNEKSVFYTGSAGTGKSVLLREIIKWFKASRKNLAITASTGIAAVNIGGTTVHSWAGIGLGLDPPKDIATKFFTNAQRFADVLKRWHQVDALIIDEISMLDGNLFDTLEYLARRIRESDLPFGGIQLILSGDFCQLPPVPSRGQQGSSKESCFTFEARSWEECVGPPIVLQKVFRQKDQHFVDMLNSMRFGHLDSSAVSAFHALSREVVYTDGIEPSELFPTRQEVDRANSTRLNKLQSEEVIYQAQDIPGTDADGNQVPWATASSLLNRLIVPKILSVKVGAQVMLVKNLFDHGLVNGSIGKIESFRTVLDAVEQGRTVGTTRSEGSGQDVSLENDPSVARLPRGRVWPVVRFSSERMLRATRFP